MSNSTTIIATISPVPAEIRDPARIRLGGGYRLPSAAVADSGRIRLGGGYRLPTV